MRFICALLLLITLKSSAQYPFEKYRPMRYDTISIKSIGENSYDHYKGFKREAFYKDYKIVFLGDSDRLADSSNILLYHHNYLIKKVKTEASVNNDFFNEPIRVGDIDGNGNLDFKIVIWNNGCGAAGDYAVKIYLINRGKDIFSSFSFFDLYNNVERDFDNNGKHEIVGQVYQQYKLHAYYIFDIYSIKNGQLVNVSNKYNYPIVVKDLWDPTYKVTHKIPKAALLKLSSKFPTDYVHD